MKSFMEIYKQERCLEISCVYFFHDLMNNKNQGNSGSISLKTVLIFKKFAAIILNDSDVTFL